MSEIFQNLPNNCLVNMIFGAIGAILVVTYRMYNSIPEIEVLLQGQWQKESVISISSKGIMIIIIKIFLSIASAALFTALIIKPQDITGAITSGMSWTGLIKDYIKK
jgi:hypothetical protein